MQAEPRRTTRLTTFTLSLAFMSVALFGGRCGGLDVLALLELHFAGVDKYIGEYAPVSSEDVGDGWVRHDFDAEGGEGPICIDGSDYAVFTRAGDPHKLLIFEQGGGACWQDFYFCSIEVAGQEPPFDREGLWDFDDPANPFADYSIVYLPYCDGSVFSSDNELVDENFPANDIRYHRGLRNQTAGMDVARSVFPDAWKITLSGSSAGGVGVSGFAPFLVRFLFGNWVDLTVLNDAGPIAVNLDATGDIQKRANDWQFGQFYAWSCTACSDEGKVTDAIDWRLDRDRSIREAWYETDADQVNRFFLATPTQEGYRALILEQSDELHAAHPDRFKRFIVSGDSTHTAVQGPLFYSQEVEGVRLNEWAAGLIAPRTNDWDDLVQDFTPLP